MTEKGNQIEQAGYVRARGHLLSWRADQGFERLTPRRVPLALFQYFEVGQ